MSHLPLCFPTNIGLLSVLQILPTCQVWVLGSLHLLLSLPSHIIYVSVQCYLLNICEMVDCIPTLPISNKAKGMFVELTWKKMPSSLKLTFKREETVVFPSGEYHPTQQHLFYSVKVFYFCISWLLQSNSWLTRSQNFYLLILEISPSSSLYKWENWFFFSPKDRILSHSNFMIFKEGVWILS